MGTADAEFTGRSKTALPRYAIFWSGKKQHCPLVRNFGTIKNSSARSCGILERQNATLPSCAEFQIGQMQNWHPVRHFKTASRNFAAFHNSLRRPRAILPLHHF